MKPQIPTSSQHPDKKWVPDHKIIDGLNEEGKDYEYLRRKKRNLDFVQWTYTPSVAINIPNTSIYNLFTDMSEGGIGMTRVDTEEKQKYILIGTNSGIESVRLKRDFDRDELVEMRITLDYTLGSSAVRAFEIGIKHPTLTTLIAPALISRLDNVYPKGKADLLLYALGKNDPFYTLGFYPEINNQSGQTISITKIDILLKRIYR